MSSGEMKAGANTLGQAANMVSTAKSDFDKLASNLMGQIQSAQAKWQGEGGSAFQNLGAAWNERQNKIVSALNQFESSLQQTQKDNQSTDSTQSGYMSKISGRLC